MSMKIYAIILFALVTMNIIGCANCKKTKTETTNVVEEEKMKAYENLTLEMVEDFNFKEKNITFPMINASLVEKEIRIKLKYGGGCKPHDFHIYTNNKPNDKNEIHLYLVDFTEDDHCRAFVLKSFSTDISSIYSTRYKYILNNSIWLY